MFRSTKLITKARTNTHTHTLSNTHAHIIRRINNNNNGQKKRKKKKRRKSAKIIIIISKKNKLYTQQEARRETRAIRKHMLRKGIKIRQERKNFCDIICVCMYTRLCLSVCVCLYFLLPLMSYERFWEAIKAWTKIGSCFWSYLQSLKRVRYVQVHQQNTLPFHHFNLWE